MKRILLASVAAAGLAFAAPALAQTTTPVPADPPPIVAQQPDTTEAPDAANPTVTPEAAPTTPTQAMPAPTPQAEVTGEGRTELATPSPTPAPQTAEAPAADTQSPAPAMQAETSGALAVPASASDVCAARTTSVHFGARGSALSRENQNAIQHATDAASACNLQTVTIVDSAQGRTHARRAQAVRATLVRQGVPEERITIAEASADAEAASTGRLDVRMQFAGAANQAALEPQATSGVNAAAEPTLQVAENTVPLAMPRAAPATPPSVAPATPSVPETSPPAEPAPGVEELGQPATPPVETPELTPNT